MEVTDVLSQDPEVMSGAVVFKGTRVPVSGVFENLAAGLSVDEILSQFPGVAREQMEGALILAMRCIESRFAGENENAD